MFGLSLSLPSFVGLGGGLVSESVDKVDILLDYFDESSESVDLQFTFDPSPRLTTFALRSSEDRRLLLDLDPYGGTDPLSMFPVILKRTADVLER